MTASTRSLGKATNNKRKASTVEAVRAVTGAGEPTPKALKVEEKPSVVVAAATPAVAPVIAASAVAAAPVVPASPSKTGWFSSFKDVLARVAGTVSATVKDQAAKSTVRRTARQTKRSTRRAAIKQRLSSIKF